jgi:hypothetical protein
MSIDARSCAECGHPSVLHDIDGGCCAYDPDAVGMFCLCEEGR